MPIISFPSNPYIGQQYSATNNLSYIWDGEKWSSMASLFGGGTNYILPAASNSVLGGVKIGSNITVDGGGVISVAVQIQSDWTQSNAVALDYIKNKPTIPAAQIQSDWNVSDNTLKSYIANKPNVPQLPTNAVGYLYNNGTGTLSWAPVTSGSSLVNGVHTLSLGSTGNTTFPTGLTLGAPRGVGTVNFTCSVDKEFQIETGTASAGRLWQFGTTGTTTFPSGLTLHRLSTPYSNITADLDKILQIATQTSGGRKEWTFGTDGSLTFPDATVQTTAFTGTGNIEFRNDTINNLAGITITNASQTTASTASIAIPANGSGVVSIVNNAKTWTFGVDGKLTAPGNLQVNGGKIILNTGGNAYVESVDYGVNSANSALNIFGGPYQKINLRAGFGTESTWTLRTNGQMIFPQGTGLFELITGPTNTFGIFANAVVGRSVTIRTSPLSGINKDWVFGADGNLTFPDYTVQSTAYLAPTTGNSVISSIGPLTISRNGMTIRVTSAGMIQMSFDSVINITGRSSINNADSVVISSPNGATTASTWYNIGAVLALGDHLTATIVDASFHRIYRLTVIMRDKDTTPGLELAVAYAIIEQIQ